MLYHCLVRRWLPLVHMYSRADNLSRRVYWANSVSQFYYNWFKN
jgi:hypothetical protein